MSDDPEDVVVGVRAGTGGPFVAGTTFDRPCSECSVPVALAPSSLRLLDRRPEVPILCAECAMRHVEDGEVEAVEWIGEKDR